MNRTLILEDFSDLADAPAAEPAGGLPDAPLDFGQDLPALDPGAFGADMPADFPADPTAELPAAFPADFPTDLPDLPATGLDDTAAAAAGGDDYERGYAAGWADSEKQSRSEKQSISAELARNLQELGFTFHEARAHVLSGIEPLLNSIVSKVLPKMISQTIGESIAEELASVASTTADTPVTILVSPASYPVVETLMSEATSLPYKLVAEETLSEWQVFFRLGEHERQLDLGEAVRAISDRISDFADQNQKALKHG